MGGGAKRRPCSSLLRLALLLACAITQTVAMEDVVVAGATKRGPERTDPAAAMEECKKAAREAKVRVHPQPSYPTHRVDPTLPIRHTDGEGEGSSTPFLSDTPPALRNAGDVVS